MDERITPPTEPEPAPVSRVASRRLRLVWWVLGPLLVVVAGLTTTAAVVHAPYLMFAPGSATSAEPLISVPKGQAYDSKGDVLFTTVSVIRPTYLEALKGWLQGDVDVFPRKLYYGDNSDAENRAQNIQQMDDSKTVAATVALERLGYRVEGSGVTLVSVEPGSPAAKTLKANDVVVAIDGKPVNDANALITVINEHKPGDTIELTIERPAASGKGDPERRTEEVTLGRKPGTDEAQIGVLIQTRVDLPIDVTIDSGDVGGPSAGLAWTLGLLDRLTPGSITGGKRVAVTGEILADGRVGQVGGVGQKAVAARQEGATLFIVPAPEAAAARETAGSMKVVGVHDLDEALDALASIGGNANDLGHPGQR